MKLNSQQVAEAFRKAFHYVPTAGQQSLIMELSEYICTAKENAVYVLRGYAGTGKTTLVSALVKTLPGFDIETVLLAPTGRAAKVLAAYSGKQAFTIHKKIYQISTGQEDIMRLKLQRNPHRNAVFVVDEASMISDSTAGNENDLFAGARVLEDLFHYVCSGYLCRLILLGDAAQLPPVGLSESPGLDIRYLTASFKLSVETAEMTEVVRQAEDSGILANATFIREHLNRNEFRLPIFKISGCSDVTRLNGNDMEEALYSSYAEAGRQDTLIICRSNKRANTYNREVRQRILGYDSQLNAGDLLMVVRNNYHWLPPSSVAGFIANGDILEVLRVRKTEELYGFTFADLQVSMLDYPEEKDFDLKVMLDTLTMETPALSWQQNKRLFDEVMLDYMDIPEKYKRIRKVKANPYFNALQVKYANALTCHKSQGGQWKHVYVEQAFMKDDRIDKEYMRWLYTAVTRATDKLFLVNFPDHFFGG